jgi:hypothetical protein
MHESRKSSSQKGRAKVVLNGFKLLTELTEEVLEAQKINRSWSKSSHQAEWVLLFLPYPAFQQDSKDDHMHLIRRILTPWIALVQLVLCNMICIEVQCKISSPSRVKVDSLQPQITSEVWPCFLKHAPTKLATMINKPKIFRYGVHWLLQITD